MNQHDSAKRPWRLNQTSQACLQAARSAFFDAEDLSAAFAALRQSGADENHPRIQRFRARLLLAAGDEDAARRDMQAALPAFGRPGFFELALAQAAAVPAMVDHGAKLLYVPVPKSGSTRLRNLFLALREGHNLGEGVHSRPDLLEPVHHHDMATRFADYERIIIWRDPADRLLSYYEGNIIERDQLVKDVSGKTQFFGLPTKPTFEIFLKHFDAYRRIFMVVRHHTAPFHIFSGADLSRYTHVRAMGDLDGLIERLSLVHSLDKPSGRPMARGNPGRVKVSDQHAGWLREVYKKDYALVEPLGL